jgi:hypothetical protein
MKINRKEIFIAGKYRLSPIDIPFFVLAFLSEAQRVINHKQKIKKSEEFQGIKNRAQGSVFLVGSL